MQPLKISNKYTLGVEKYLLNIADDVISSHSVVVKNAFRMLWSGRDINMRCISFILVGRIFQRKVDNTKVTCILVDKTHRKIRGKVEISSAPYNAEGVQNGIPYYIKGEEIIFDFDQKL